jgi:hypothetical protein
MRSMTEKGSSHTKGREECKKKPCGCDFKFEWVLL